MSRYAHARSLVHAERILRDQAREVRRLAADEEGTHSGQQRAALRGKGAAYSEAADLLVVLWRKWLAGELDENRRSVPAVSTKARRDSDADATLTADPEMLAAFATEESVAIVPWSAGADD